MRVLCACEESQAVCIAFRNRGHEAYSCDLIPCSGGHPEWHIQGDALEIIKGSWDLVIAFPPCTHLAVSGARHFSQKRKDGRQQQAIEFFMQFTRLKCRWAIENPVGIMSRYYRKPDQVIHPWQFGHTTTKATCLWLCGLPLLKPTKIISKDDRTNEIHQARFDGKFVRWNSEECKRLRSKTFLGIADAMADQWGSPSGKTIDERDLFEVSLIF